MGNSLPLFLIPMLSGLVAQSFKPFLNRRFYSSLEIAGRQVPRYGGMPSAHSAFTSSLATMAAVTEGVQSMSFAIAMTIFILTIDDALRMRLFLGKYGFAIKKLTKQLPEKERKQMPYIESRLGHKPSEVLAGILLGVTFTILVLVLFS